MLSGYGLFVFFFFFNDTATTEIYTLSDTLSLHDALPICIRSIIHSRGPRVSLWWPRGCRSEEHTSELQSPLNISYAVFCLKKKKQSPSATDVLQADDNNCRRNRRNHG